MSKVYAYEVYKNGKLVYKADKQTDAADFLGAHKASVNSYCQVSRVGYHIEDRIKEEGLVKVYKNGDLYTKAFTLKELKDKLGLSLSSIYTYNSWTKKGIEIVEPETQTVYALYHGKDADTLLIIGTAEEIEKQYGIDQERLDYYTYPSFKGRTHGGFKAISWEERVE